MASCNILLCNDAYQTLAATCNYFSKIEIEGQNDATFLSGKFKNVAIWESLQITFSQMKHIMTMFAEPIDNSAGNSHVS